MALPPRILLDQPFLSAGLCVAPDGPLLHRLLRVLRLREGAPVILGSPDGTTWNGTLIRGDGGWALRVDSPRPQDPSRGGWECPPFVLVMGLLKGDRTEWAVQKATEAGVREVHVVVMRHSVPRPEGPEARRRLERIQRVAREAARQCGRPAAPEVLLWPGLEAVGPAIDRWKDRNLPRFLLDERPGAPSLAAVLRQAPGAILASGPEGSFAPEERHLLEDRGFLPAGLGPRILRAETAALVGLVVAQVVCGDMGAEVSCDHPPEDAP